ncbi:hypothetical protein [Planomicrobium okeanokoites]|uniref:hypothetical protein n=1 Tax=Planomicrobium okeanokoites TaxID=244 RepID=UPI000A023729|nr:hypothetical protein [Planomicrobium okeanokoites]
MTTEIFLFNIAILIILTILMENGLRKAIKEKVVRVTRVFWGLLMPTYILATIFTVLLLFLRTPESLDLLFLLQKYALCGHVIACLLFIAALDGAKTSAKVIQ